MVRLPIALVALACVLSAAAAPALAGPRPAARPPAAKPAAWKPAVPFLEDDFGRALALAKERKLPVFIEGWAPW
jgi:hypothetical protein